MSAPLPDDPPPPTDSQKTQPDDVPAQKSTESQTSTVQVPEWESLRAQVRAKPNDSDAWLKLVDVAVASGDYDRVNETYEALLEAYPNTVRIAYLIYSHSMSELWHLSHPPNLHISTTFWIPRGKQNIKRPKDCLKDF